MVTILGRTPDDVPATTACGHLTADVDGDPRMLGAEAGTGQVRTSGRPALFADESWIAAPRLVAPFILVPIRMIQNADLAKARAWALAMETNDD